MTAFSQGGESNVNGRWLEEIVRNEARLRSIPIRDYQVDGDNRDLFGSVILVGRVPYKSLYGLESTSEFVLQFYERRIRIECRVQETAGSVDEKFPYLFWNARDYMPEQEVVILMHGDGPRAEAMAWLRRQCQAVETKTIRVFNISDYRRWFKELWKQTPYASAAR